MKPTVRKTGPKVVTPAFDHAIRLHRASVIFAGLRASYPDPTVLVGRRVVVVANLKPRQMKFGLSEGMILAAGKMVLAADESAKPGDKVS